MLICGIDEAGRGPVIGPMVMCGVTIEESKIKELQNLGVKDSKLLSPKQREYMFKEIKHLVKDYKIIIIPPKEIDEAVESEELNLNKLEAIKSAMIINHLKPNKAMLDCPSNNPKKYLDYLKIYIKDNSAEIKAEHKADLKYPVVSAASILAKVTRDKEIEKIKKEIKEDIGSGYPADPITVKFLKNNYKKYPSIFRKSWASYKNILTQSNQKKLNNF